MLSNARFAESDGRFRLAGTTRPNDPVFAGHFPGAPVFPGVCSLALMMRVSELTAARTMSGRWRAVSASGVKFAHPIKPGDRIVIEARVTGYDGTRMMIDAEIVGEDGRRKTTGSIGCEISGSLR